MKQLALELRSFFERLTASGGSAQVETATVLRIDEVSVTSSDFVRELKDLTLRLGSEGIGTIELFGEVSDSIDIKDFDLADVENDRLTVILEKPANDGWCYFLTIKGFENWLRTNQFSTQNSQKKMCVWVAGETFEFSTHQFLVKEIGGDKNLPTATQHPEKPWKTVRDLTHSLTPQ